MGEIEETQALIDEIPSTIKRLEGMDLAELISFVISLSMLTIGIAFLAGFVVKKMLQFLKSF